MAEPFDVVEIRFAGPADTNGVVRLLGLLFDQEAEFEPDPAAQRAGIEALLASHPHAVVVVAERNSTLIGVATLQMMVSTALGAKVAIIEDMVVHPTARSTGVGAALLARLLDHAQSLGCRRITLLSDGDNTTGHRFYQRHGFVMSSMVPMRLELPC